MKQRIGGRVTYVPRGQQPTNQAQPPRTVAPANQQSQQNPTYQQNYHDMTAQEQSAMLNAQRQLRNLASYNAIQTYTTDDAYANGTPRSTAQNVNYKLETGQTLTAKESAMVNGIEKVAVPVGANINLYRADHDTILRSLGLNNWYNMSQSQLQNAVVGAQVSTRALTSTSHDVSKNPFWNNGGREVLMNIKAASTTRGTMVQKSQAEIVLPRGTNMRITGIRYTGRTVRPAQSPRSYPQVIIDVETW